MLSFYKIYIFEELDYIIIDLKPSVVSEWLMADEIVQSLMLGTAVFYFMFLSCWEFNLLHVDQTADIQ